MPRTLPWLTGTGSKDEKARNTPHRRQVKPKKDSDDYNGARGAPPTSRSERRDFFRSSPSPPSSPIKSCPSEEFIIEGFDNDDIYMMVEDEFYAVAQTFTQHLHYAEYVKRKKEAKQQNAATIQNFARPTDGVTPVSDETKRREVAAALSTRQSTGLEEMEGSRPRVDSEQEGEDTGEDDDDAFHGTSLHGLMMSPRKVRSLVGMQGIRSSTRAAAGYAQASLANKDRNNDANIVSLSRDVTSSHTVDKTASEDDDLDLQTDRPSATSVKEKTFTRSISDNSIIKTQPPITSLTEHYGRKEKQFMNARNIEDASKSRKRVFFDDFDELPELPKSEVSAHARRTSPSIGKNHPENARGGNLKSKKSRLNEVPTFLL